MRGIPRRRPYLLENGPLSPVPGDPATVPTRLCSWAPSHHAQTGGDALGTRTPPACSSKPPPLWPQPSPSFWVLRPAPSLLSPLLSSGPFQSSWTLWVSMQPPRPLPRPGALPPPRRAPRPSLSLTRSHAFTETAPPRLALPPSLGFLPPLLRLRCKKGACASNFSALTSLRPREADGTRHCTGAPLGHPTRTKATQSRWNG